MRPIASRQNVLRHPLNQFLGTEAHVRLLRVLADEIEGPLAASELAERAGLSMMGARKALLKLVDSGFVERVGGGRKQLYTLRGSDPLVKRAASLFREERRRYETLIAALRQEAQRLAPAPQSVWIRGLPLQPGDPLDIGILGRSADLSATTLDARARFSRIERAFDLTVEISGYTRADVPELEPERVTLLAGMPPAVPSANTVRSHRDLDERSLRRSKTLVSLIQKDPSLIRRARASIDRLLKENQGTASRDLKEWRGILESYTPRRLLRFLESSSARAARLRQSNPFLAVLDHKEQARLAGSAGGRRG